MMSGTDFHLDIPIRVDIRTMECYNLGHDLPDPMFHRHTPTITLGADSHIERRIARKEMTRFE
jgi:hypothetical protein